MTVTDVLRRFTGDPGLAAPDRVIRQLWTRDPYALGTSSYPSVVAEDDDFEKLSRPLPSEADPRLLFAGEATDAKHWGQMLGARLSGLREANRVLERMEAVERIAEEMRKISLSPTESQCSSAASTLMTSAAKMASANGGRPSSNSNQNQLQWKKDLPPPVLIRAKMFE